MCGQRGSKLFKYVLLVYYNFVFFSYMHCINVTNEILEIINVSCVHYF